MADKKIFINCSENEDDRLIAEALVKQIRATGMFKNEHIHDRGSLTAGEEESALLALVKQDDAVIHLLSAYFFQEGQECYRVWNESIDLSETKIFPVRIREFLWERRADLQRFSNRIIPDKDTPVASFSAKDASASDTMLRNTVKQIFERIDGVTYQDRRGAARPAVRAAAVLVAIAGIAGAVLTYYLFAHILLSIFIAVLALLLAGFLFSMLKLSTLLSLAKSSK